MKLNFNSPISKTYRWFYATDQMPQNLCPYFWKLVLMWILIVPYVILSLPYLIAYKKDKGNSVAEKPGSGLMIWVALGMVAAMLFSFSLFWTVFPKDSFLQQMQILGVVLWLVAVVLVAYQGILWIKEKYKESKIKYDENGRRIWRPVEEKSPSIIKEFIKAKYNKYCPKIDWKK